MTKLNNQSKVTIEMHLSFNEDWETEEELVELGKKYGYQIEEVYELHGYSGGSAEVLATATIKKLLDNDLAYEKDGKYYDGLVEEEITEDDLAEIIEITKNDL